jgi:hypothetical protein
MPLLVHLSLLIHTSHVCRPEENQLPFSLAAGRIFSSTLLCVLNTVEPSYNNIGLCDTSPTHQIFCGTSELLTVNHNIRELGCNATSL